MQGCGALLHVISLVDWPKHVSTANEIALAEFGRFPLQVHFWQQILRYHSRLVKLAMVDGCTLSTNQSVTAATNKG